MDVGDGKYTLGFGIIFESGWTNRIYDESELYFEGDYQRTH